MNKTPIYALHNWANNNKIDIRRYDDTSAHQLHFHDCIEMFIMLHGTGVHFVNGKEYNLEKHSFSILKTNDFHSIYNLSKSNCFFNIMINPSLFSEETVDFIENSDIFSINLPEASSKQIVYIFKIIHQAQISEQNYSDSFYKNLFDALFMILKKNQPNSLHQRAYDVKFNSPLQKAFSFINKNFKVNISSIDVANHVGYSVSYFSDLFHKKTGKTCNKYINELRIEYAKNLLVSTNNSVTHICFSSGFISMTSFIRNFTEATSLSPSAFRKLMNNK